MQMHLHGPGIGLWHHDRRPDATRRADGAEQIGVLIALIGGLAWPGTFAGPKAGKPILLTDPCLILPPNLDGFCDGNTAQVGAKRVGEVFLNASITRTFCFGCCGRALI
jgi:hypothetical protein